MKGTETKNPIGNHYEKDGKLGSSLDKLRGSSNKKWYVIYTKPRQEAVGALHLERQQFEVYFPRIDVTKRHKNELTTGIEPFFPRYIFIKLDINHDDWSPIRSTRGVTGLVRFEGVPKPVPSLLIDALMENESSENLQKITKKTWKPGDSVAIEQGPFAGYNCIFQKQGSADRVYVLLNIIGKPTRTTLSKQDLQIPQFA